MHVLRNKIKCTRNIIKCEKNGKKNETTNVDLLTPPLQRVTARFWVGRRYITQLRGKKNASHAPSSHLKGLLAHLPIGYILDAGLPLSGTLLTFISKRANTHNPTVCRRRYCLPCRGYLSYYHFRLFRQSRRVWEYFFLFPQLIRVLEVSPKYIICDVFACTSTKL